MHIHFLVDQMINQIKTDKMQMVKMVMVKLEMEMEMDKLVMEMVEMEMVVEMVVGIVEASPSYPS